MICADNTSKLRKMYKAYGRNVRIFVMRTKKRKMNFNQDDVMITNMIHNCTFLDESFVEQLKAGEDIRLRYLDDSMKPLVRSIFDEYILTALRQTSLSVGNVVLAKTDKGKYVINRIVSIKGEQITLRGDGRPYERNYCRPDSVLGEIKAICHKGKTIDKDSAAWLLTKNFWPSSPFLRLLLIGLGKKIKILSI